MKIEIDQSGKIEMTEKDTILAFSTDDKKRIKTGSVKITAKTKRRLQEYFRQIGEPRGFVINTFACAIFLLLKDNLLNVDEINIDLEYPGKNLIIAGLLSLMLESCQNGTVPPVRFILVGKESIAHEVAIRIYHKRMKADKVLNYELLSANLFTTKNGCPTLKYQVSDKR